LNDVELLLKPWFDHTLENTANLNQNFGVKFKRLSFSWRFKELYSCCSNLVAFIGVYLLAISQGAETLFEQSDHAPLIVAVLDKILVYH